jgi:hypothetical protein
MRSSRTTNGGRELVVTIKLEELFESVKPLIGLGGTVVSNPEPWLVHGEPWMPVAAEIVPTSFNEMLEGEELVVKFRLRRLHTMAKKGD